MAEFIPYKNVTGLKFADGTEKAFTARAVFTEPDPMTIPLTQAIVSKGTDFPIPTGSVIDLGTGTGISVGGVKKFYKVGTGANPVIKFRGGDQSAPFSIARTARATFTGIDFDLSPGCYAWFSRGGVTATDCHVLTPGGLIALRSADGDNILTNCSFTLAGYYGVLTGAEVPQKDAAGNYVLKDGAPIVLLNKSLQLINCSGSGKDQDPTKPATDVYTRQHVVRVHAMNYVKIQGGKYTGPTAAAGHCATVRIHDAVKADVSGVEIVGKTYFAPLAGGDGGANIDLRKIKTDDKGKPVLDSAGKPVRIDGTIDPNFQAERVAAGRARLGSLLISHTTITGDTKVGSGMTGRIEDSTIDTLSGHVAITAEGDYIGRGEPVLDIVRTKLIVRDGVKAMPWTGGRTRIRTGGGVTFQAGTIAASTLKADPAVKA